MSDEQAQETAVATTRKQGIVMSSQGGLQLTGLNDMYRFSEYVIASGLAPKGFKTAEEVLITLEFGLELGLKPLQALQNIAPINGRVAVWGDAVPGLVKSSGLLAFYDQEELGAKYQDTYGWRVTSLRKGTTKPVVTTFLVSDAKKAGLWGKQGPWTTNPDRMLLNRCRTFNHRDNFPDVLKGLITVEEARDVRDAEYEIIAAEPATRTETLEQKIAAQVEKPTTVAETAAEVITPETKPEPEPVTTPEPEVKQESAPEPAGKRPYTIGYGVHENVFLTVKELNEFIDRYGKDPVDEIIHEFSTAIKEKGMEGTYKNHQKTLAASLAKKFPSDPAQTGLGI